MKMNQEFGKSNFVRKIQKNTFIISIPEPNQIEIKLGKITNLEQAIDVYAR